MSVLKPKKPDTSAQQRALEEQRKENERMAKEAADKETAEKSKREDMKRRQRYGRRSLIGTDEGEMGVE